MLTLLKLKLIFPGGFYGTNFPHTLLPLCLFMQIRDKSRRPIGYFLRQKKRTIKATNYTNNNGSNILRNSNKYAKKNVVGPHKTPPPHPVT